MSFFFSFFLTDIFYIGIKSECSSPVKNTLKYANSPNYPSTFTKDHLREFQLVILELTCTSRFKNYCMG